MVTLLERAGWIESNETSFEKDGRSITYRKLSLTKARPSMQEIETLETVSASQPGERRKKRRARKKRTKRRSQLHNQPILEGTSGRRFERLRAWRLEQARRKSIPAFRILTDKALLAICERQPHSRTELFEISGISRKSVTQYADDIFESLETHPSALSLHMARLCRFTALHRTGQTRVGGRVLTLSNRYGILPSFWGGLCIDYRSFPSSHYF